MPTTFPLGVCAITGGPNPIHPLPAPAQALLDRGTVTAYTFTYRVSNHRCRPGASGVSVYAPGTTTRYRYLTGWRDLLDSGIEGLNEAIVSLTHPVALYALPIQRVWRHVAPEQPSIQPDFNLTIVVLRDHAWIGYAYIDDDNETMTNAIDRVMANHQGEERESKLAQLLDTRAFDGACVGTLLLHAPSITTAHQRLGLPALVQAQADTYLGLIYGCDNTPGQALSLHWPLVPPNAERIAEALNMPLEL